MKLAYKFLMMVGLTLGLTPASYAASLDFAEIVGDPSGQSTLNLSNATLTHDNSANGFFYTPDISGFSLNSTNGKGSICALDGPQCLGSMTITFKQDIQNLSFGFAGGKTGDEVYVSGWKEGTPTNFTNITSNGIFDFSFLGIVDKIILFNDSQAGGFLYQDFKFDMVADNETVLSTPLPAALPMFGAALMGLMGLRFRRKGKGS